MEFVSAVRNLGVSRKHSQHNDDLFVDRLNHRYTVVIIIIFCMVVTMSQYGGSPIHCWVPGHFTGNYANYADNICWVSSTYNVPLNEDLPHNENDRKVKMLKYYQWTPFILLFQALLFYLPRMIWRSLNDKSGLDIQSIVDAVYSFQTDASKYSDRQKLLNYLTNSFDHYVNSIKDPCSVSNGSFETRTTVVSDSNNIRRRNVYSNEDKDNSLVKKNIDNDNDEYFDNELEDNEIENSGNQENENSRFSNKLNALKRLGKIMCITKGKRYGNYLMALFVFVKVLYTCNSIIQLFMLNHFLGNDFLLLGIEVLGKIWAGDDWTQLKRFPRVTMCDFRIREVGIVHRYTVQCVLSINLFNEKIFIFLWFWLCLVSIFNVFDLISWSYTLIINNQDRYSYVKRRLTALNPSPGSTKPTHVYLANSEERRLFKKFVNNYLREDGVLALRLLSRNSQDLIVSEVVCSLFNLYKKQYNRQHSNHHQQQHNQSNIQSRNRETSSVDDVDETNNPNSSFIPRYQPKLPYTNEELTVKPVQAYLQQ